MKAKFFNLLALFFFCMSLYAQQKIIGGSAIDISQRPYQAAIFINGQFTGGGVIINNQWILTAAHVVHNRSASSVTVSTGYTNLNNDPAKSAVSQIYEHPNYISDEKNYMPNDIALVKLTSPLTFGSTRKPIRISSATTYSIGSTATVSGWGSRSQSSPNIASSNQLYKTTGTISKCNTIYLKYIRIRC